MAGKAAAELRGQTRVSDYLSVESEFHKYFSEKAYNGSSAHK